MVVKVAVPQRFKLRIIPDIRNLIFGGGGEFINWRDRSAAAASGRQ